MFGSIFFTKERIGDTKVMDKRLSKGLAKLSLAKSTQKEKIRT